MGKTAKRGLVLGSVPRTATASTTESFACATALAGCPASGPKKSVQSFRILPTARYAGSFYYWFHSGYHLDIMVHFRCTWRGGILTTGLSILATTATRSWAWSKWFATRTATGLERSHLANKARAALNPDTIAAPPPSCLMPSTMVLQSRWLTFLRIDFNAQESGQMVSRWLAF